MNLTVAQEEWLQALESGDYNQVTGMLKKGDVGFCCLGVACDVWGEGGWNGDVFSDGDESSALLLIVSVCAWLGMESNGSIFHQKLNKKDRAGLSRYNSLVQMNDDGVTFKNIARLVRRNPGAFFV